MSEDKLVLNTRESLYDPIEIEIDNKTYQSIKMTHSVQMELNKLDEQITTKNNEPLYKIVEFLYGVSRKILNELAVQEVEDIYFHTKKKLLEINTERLKLIANTFGKEVKRTIPKNRKRPGSKA